MLITHEYFMKEWHSFRAIMGSIEYTMEQKQDAWTGLIAVSLQCERTPEQEEIQKTAMAILAAEVPIRLGLELTIELSKLIGSRGD